MDTFDNYDPAGTRIGRKTELRLEPYDILPAKLPGVEFPKIGVLLGFAVLISKAQ